MSVYGTELAKPALRPKGGYYQKKRTLAILAAPTMQRRGARGKADFGNPPQQARRATLSDS
jgi:hypothetical protein